MSPLRFILFTQIQEKIDDIFKCMNFRRNFSNRKKENVPLFPTFFLQREKWHVKNIKIEKLKIALLLLWD